MNGGSEKDRATTGWGRGIGPNRSNHLGRSGCVLGPSTAGRLGFTPEASRLVCVGFSRKQQPPGGSESGERSEPVPASAVGPARAASDRTEARPTGASGASGGRGPTGRAELVCGRGRGSSRTPHPTSRGDRARPTPRTGTCLLRRLSGSAALLTGGRERETVESGVER
jgi:hypothetical protein